MTPSFSPTLGTPRANRWKSTPDCPLLMPKEPTTRQWNYFPFSDGKSCATAWCEGSLFCLFHHINCVYGQPSLPVSIE